MTSKNTTQTLSEFPEWDPNTLREEWISTEDGTWLLPLKQPISIRTPWVRLLDYSLPGYVETDLPEEWVDRILSWEEGFLQEASHRPSPPVSSAPVGRTAWKRVVHPWVHVASSDRYRVRWTVSHRKSLPVFVGTSRTSEKPVDVLAPGQWIKFNVRLLGWSWNGRTAQLLLMADQALVRQRWRDEAQPLAQRALDAARSALLLGLEEEKILSLLNISSG